MDPMWGCMSDETYWNEDLARDAVLEAAVMDTEQDHDAAPAVRTKRTADAAALEADAGLVKITQ